MKNYYNSIIIMIKIKSKSKKQKYESIYDKLSNDELEREAIKLVELLNKTENQTNDELLVIENKIKLLKKVINNKLGKMDDINDRLNPYITDTNFNKKIYQKMEYHQNKIMLDPKNIDKIIENSCKQDKFTLLPTQLFLKNFISPETPYNGILLFHGTGVGKTCSSITIAEQFKPLVEKNNTKIYVLLPNTIKDGFMRNIFNIDKYIQDMNQGEKQSLQCTGNSYFNELGDIGNYLLKQGMRDKLEKKTNKLIKKHYSFWGYLEFANYVEKIEEQSIKGYPEDRHLYRKKQALSEKFSNSIFIIDEVHHIRDSSTNEENKRVPPIIKRVLEYTNNIKLIMLSATPMFNIATEIIWILNMLLLNDNRATIKEGDIFDSNGKLKPNGRELLIKNASGYISYLRGENPFDFPFRLYPDINNDNNYVPIDKIPDTKWNGTTIDKENRIKYLKLVKSEMNEIQNNLYLEYLSTIDEDKTQSALDISIQISNLVYPNINDDTLLIGNQGFKNIFNGNYQDGFSYNKKILNTYGEIFNIDLIKSYSTKLHSILNYIEKSEGIVYIYSRYIYGGLLPLAIALEHIGYSRYGKNSLLNSNNKLEKRGSYIMITGQKEFSENKDLEIRECVKAENKDGKNIKIILGSQASTEGIDFQNIREIHILEPWFHLNTLEQAIGRGIRYCKHINLPYEKRNVTIYLHVATLMKPNEMIETIDIYRYRKSEQKSIEMSKVERILKQVAIDCNLNKMGNVYLKSVWGKTVDIITSQKTKTQVVLGDTEFSRICDFSENCDYDCIPKIENIEELPIINTYNFTLNNNLIENVLEFLQELYSLDIIYDLNEIQIFILKTNNFKIDEQLLYLVLDTIIEKKNNLINRNRNGYLIYRHDFYIWQERNFIEDISVTNRYRLPNKKNEKVSLTNMIIKKEITQDIDVSLLLDNIESLSKKMSHLDRIYYKIRLQMFIDQFSETELNLLIKYIILEYGKDKENKFISNLLDILDNRILYEKDKMLGFIGFDEKSNILYYCLHSDGNIKICNKLQSDRIDGNRLRQYKKDNLIKDCHTNKMYGFISRNYSQTNTIFKLVDVDNKISSGKNCTSLKTIDTVIEFIKKIDDTKTENIIDLVKLYFPDYIEGGTSTKVKSIKIKKKVLCEIVQFILRFNDIIKLNNKRWFYNENEYNYIENNN